MNTQYLQTFLSIVETGSLMRASVQLNVTQSTVTARLKALEAELGQTLLHRDKSGATLTPAGVKFLHYARTILGLWRQARRDTALPKGLASMCTFGCNPDLWNGPGATAAQHIADTQPDMALTILRGSDAELEAWLAEGLIDFGISHRANLRTGQTVHELPPVILALYATAPDLPVVGSGKYIFVDYGEEFRDRHGESYFDADVARVEFSAPDWAMTYMAQSGGLAYLPVDQATAEEAAGRLFRLQAAPEYHQKRFLVARDRTARNWAWFDMLIETLWQ